MKPCANGGHLVGADNSNGQALLAGDKQRLVHFLERLVEGLDLHPQAQTVRIASPNIE